MNSNHTSINSSIKLVGQIFYKISALPSGGREIIKIKIVSDDDVTISFQINFRLGTQTTGVQSYRIFKPHSLDQHSW